MDRFRKLKKEKSPKTAPKEKQPLFITDVKSFKENIKIKEILRTVKMNSSMRLKAPPGSKVMNNKDFNEEDCFEESTGTQHSSVVLSATNPDVVTSNVERKTDETDSDNNSSNSNQECDKENEINVDVEENIHTTTYFTADPTCIKQSIKQNECNNDENDIGKTNITNGVTNGKSNETTRERKLSLDQNVLVRREGLSQSELDLHSIGKSPLERKSSFFRKTMDSFVRNTTEMFRKQNKSLQRRVSLSVSLQSLNDKTLTCNDYRGVPIQQVNNGLDDSRTDLLTTTQIARSNSSLSSTVQRQSSEQSLAESYAGSQPTLHPLPTSTLENVKSCSVHSLNEAYLKDAMLNSRAISMSSGLDSPFGQPRRKTSRSNRVTWVASEGLTNYLRRVIQDEKTREMQSCQSYQDFSCIPENEQYNRKPDPSKGRRLSYQRAVSGEDPVAPIRHTDSMLRKKHQIPEICETSWRFTNSLNVYDAIALFERGTAAYKPIHLVGSPEGSYGYRYAIAQQHDTDDDTTKDNAPTTTPNTNTDTNTKTLHRLCRRRRGPCFLTSPRRGLAKLCRVLFDVTVT